MQHLYLYKYEHMYFVWFIFLHISTVKLGMLDDNEVILYEVAIKLFKSEYIEYHTSCDKISI